MKKQLYYKHNLNISFGIGAILFYVLSIMQIGRLARYNIHVTTFYVMAKILLSLIIASFVGYIFGCITGISTKRK